MILIKMSLHLVLRKLTTKLTEFGDIKKKEETCLPATDSKVTDFKMIYKYLKYLQELAAHTNLPLMLH